MQQEVIKGLELEVTSNLPICFKATSNDSSMKDELEETTTKAVRSIRIILQ